ncbi:hypothetical protein JIN77_16380 [Verrucomicrobiaceae bacterium R5-34]|uniref:DUF177 domain-containing protein n=1 Tax=Oceaniferula flava TaxID=2800421 RepID=A0AAE2V7T3_9BACT|nr:hypothetical protein [Oceaniferula flavus]MBK1832317.1 hypothetical protein [Verrucomicrobiaceae bacterium R5-34]MBK1854352.1 hypothetical protein [Oceaniferula flavus]MBM1135658.1 hypothetical protein [Oceaniferula flavus]
MKKHLNIDLNSLPEEGKVYSGELDPSIFALQPTHSHKRNKEAPVATDPLFYDLHVQRFDQELLVRGSISVPIEFSCVRCLSRYVKTIAIEDCAISSEITASQVDLADDLREEIVVLYPDYPHCDEGDEPKECILDSRYLAVDKPTEDEVKTPPRDEAPNPWDALDAFDDDADTSS